MRLGTACGGRRGPMARSLGPHQPLESGASQHNVTLVDRGVGGRWEDLDGSHICLLKGGGLPKFLSGELLFTASDLVDRTHHWALNMGTPYKDLHGKEATLQHLRFIGSRCFWAHRNVHQEAGR